MDQPTRRNPTRSARNNARYRDDDDNDDDDDDDADDDDSMRIDEAISTTTTTTTSITTMSTSALSVLSYIQALLAPILSAPSPVSSSVSHRSAVDLDRSPR